ELRRLDLPFVRLPDDDPLARRHVPERAHDPHDLVTPLPQRVREGPADHAARTGYGYAHLISLRRRPSPVTGQRHVTLLACAGLLVSVGQLVLGLQQVEHLPATAVEPFGLARLVSGQ